MGQSSHQAAGDKLAERFLRESGGGTVLADADAWRRDPANRDLCDIYAQPFSAWTPGQLAALSLLITAGRAGDIEITGVEVGQEPRRDSARRENQMALSQLPHGIKAEVYIEGDCHDSDGDVDIPDGLQIVDTTEQAATPAQARGWTKIPLEIGHTDATRTWLHLCQEGALARWPYGSDVLYVVETARAWGPAYDFGEIIAAGVERHSERYAP